MAKGLRTVVGERFGDEAVKGGNFEKAPSFQNVQTKQKIYFLGKKQDELVAILEAEEDFQDSSTLLEERMAQIGARVVTLTKFHPEFNPIECVYRFKNQTKI